MFSSKDIGKIGEDLAENYLKNRGYKILERNYKKHLGGEIDIIAQKNKTLIFVEVKTLLQSENAKFLPEDNINYFKKKKLIKTAKLYLFQNRISPETEWQIDVIAIELDDNGKMLDLRHIEKAVFE